MKRYSLLVFLFFIGQACSSEYQLRSLKGNAYLPDVYFKNIRHQFLNNLKIDGKNYKVGFVWGDRNQCLLRAFLGSIYEGHGFEYKRSSKEVREFFVEKIVEKLDSINLKESLNLMELLVFYFEKEILICNNRLNAFASLLFLQNFEEIKKHLINVIQLRDGTKKFASQDFGSLETTAVQNLLDALKFEDKEFWVQFSINWIGSYFGYQEAPSVLGVIVCELYNKSLLIYDRNGKKIENYGNGDPVKLFYCTYLSPDITGSNSPNHYAILRKEAKYNPIDPSYLFLNSIGEEHAKEFLFYIPGHESFDLNAIIKNINHILKNQPDKKREIFSNLICYIDFFKKDIKELKELCKSCRMSDLYDEYLKYGYSSFRQFKTIKGPKNELDKIFKGTERMSGVGGIVCHMLTNFWKSVLRKKNYDKQFHEKVLNRLLKKSSNDRETSIVQCVIDSKEYSILASFSDILGILGIYFEMSDSDDSNFSGAESIGYSSDEDVFADSTIIFLKKTEGSNQNQFNPDKIKNINGSKKRKTK